MAEIIFIYEGKSLTIRGNTNQTMKDICSHFCVKINKNLNSLIFLYDGNVLNLKKTLNETTKENKISILVYDDENDLCSKCGRLLNNKKIDEIISLNNNINDTLLGLYSQIENIINDINNRKDIKYVNNQLKNINLILNKTTDDIKNMNNELSIIKLSNFETTSLKTIINESINHRKKNEIDSINNEILCIYNKQDYKISLLHDYSKIDYLFPEYQKFYLDGKKYINENNIDIYINDKKIKFTYNYKSDKMGKIQVKFKFNKLISKINHIFWGCTSLESIDLTSFNASNIDNMSCMFYECTSLKSINLSLFDTSKVYNMSHMFFCCKSLKSLDLSSFNTNKVEDMNCMFCECSSLESLNLSSFNTSNVENMNLMFAECSSLKILDLSSFRTNNVKEIKLMFKGCISLKKTNIKINNCEDKILSQIDNLMKKNY